MQNPTYPSQTVRAIATGVGVKYLAPNIARIARDADRSATLVRRWLNGERVGDTSAARIRKVLGLENQNE